MPSFLDKSLADVPDQTAVPAGEYHLTFKSAAIVEKNDDPSRHNLKVTLTIDGQPNAFPVVTYYSLPNDSDSSDEEVRKLRYLKNFSKALDVDGETLMNCLRSAYEAFVNQADQASAFSPLLGTGFTAILKEEEYNGNISNKIGRIV